MKYNWKVGKHNKNIDNLGLQLEKLLRMNNENKYSTRVRYKKAQERFIIYLGRNFRLQNLSNLSDKHMEAYGRYLICSKRSKSYIKTELSAIRAMHGLIPGKKYQLMTPDAFNAKMFDDYTDPVHRKWNDREMTDFIEYARSVDRLDYARVVEIMRLLKIPLEQVFGIKSKDVEMSIVSKVLIIESCTGDSVTIELSVDQVIGLNKLLSDKSTRYFYCLNDNESINGFKRKFSRFIYDHSDQFSESKGTLKHERLTMKGLMERL